MVRNGRIKSPINYGIAMSQEQARQRRSDAGMMPEGSIRFDNTTKSPAQAYLPGRLRIRPAANTQGAITGAAKVSSAEYEPKSTKVMIRQTRSVRA